jgi:hypothetical protein
LSLWLSWSAVCMWETENKIILYNKLLFSGSVDRSPQCSIVYTVSLQFLTSDKSGT